MSDTDADWRAIGESDPYWGVMSAPQFRREALDDDALREFFEAGRRDVDIIVESVTRFTARPPGGRALDFGCGVGRLAEAMADHAESVTGYDASPGMLAEARRRAGRATYVDALPEGPFDWINAYIVFQHIAPERGLPLIRDLAARLAPDGALSLHVTFSREERAPPPPPPPVPPPPPPPPSLLRRIARRLLGRKAPTVPPPPAADPRPVGGVSMFDYELSAVFDVLWRERVRTFGLQPVEHGPHWGFIICGRKF